MGLFERALGKQPVRSVTLYHSPTRLDCAAAKRFFAEHGVQVTEIDVTSGETVREQMVKRLGRLATPAIVIGNQVFWGFEDNKDEIAELLGIRS